MFQFMFYPIVRRKIWAIRKEASPKLQDSVVSDTVALKQEIRSAIAAMHTSDVPLETNMLSSAKGFFSGFVAAAYLVTAEEGNSI